MSQKDTIRVLTDDFSNLEVKGALPGLGIDKALQVAVDVGRDSLKKSIDEILEEILHILSNAPLESDKLEVSEIKFTLSVNSSGEVSLVSLAKGSLGGQTGLEFTIVKRRNENG
ncbi:MAG: hypothetical protein HYZ49_08660 [Chloroflexi bacterium]|nr:hypothetical protein [Chloroflexota bacterium]